MSNKTGKFLIDLGLADIKVKHVSQDVSGNYHLDIICTAKSTVCSKCKALISQPCGYCKETIIEHLPILEKRVFLHVKWPRFKCHSCDGTSTSFHPDWLNKTGQKSLGFENYILKSLINSTIKDVAERTGLTEETVEGILNRRVNTEYDFKLEKPTVIGIDEIALRKGHKQYLTIVSDLSKAGQTKIIDVIQGRTKEELKPFMDSIPDEVLYGLESICVDMGASYLSALKERINNEHFFNYVVTIDRFHVAKQVGERVDKERKKLINKLKKEHEENEQTLEKIKGTMWPFRHHPEALSDEEHRQLNDLFDLSSELKACYELRESLYAIFEHHHSKTSAKKAIADWVEQANEYPAFDSFIKTYESHKANILNYFTHRRTSGPVEGLNNKIKVVKRRGFGFRNIGNFAKRLFLDINYKSEFRPAFS